MFEKAFEKAFVRVYCSSFELRIGKELVKVLT